MSTKKKTRPGRMLSHVDSKGRIRMVDVSEKESTRREATAESFVRLSRATITLISNGGLPKGDALETSRLAGILAAKRTPDLIPLCHPLALTHIEVQAKAQPSGVRFVSVVTCF